MGKRLIADKVYSDIINAFLDAGYCFGNFCGEIADKQPIVILRHDIDFCVDAALKIAAIERKLGVSSTFFFMLNSPFYNIFSKRVYEQMVDIVLMGHTIAFHIDRVFCEMPSFAKKTHSLFCQWLEFANKNIVSIHRPGCINPDNEIPEGCVSAYDIKYTQGMKYFSDSGCRWREFPMESKEFSERKNIQLLLHPIWWVYEGKNATEKFESFLAEKHLLFKQEVQNNFTDKI
jgi:hypothetical protein